MTSSPAPQGLRRPELVLTGEAVALDLPVASVGVRAVAGAIDVAVAIVVLVVGSLAGGVAGLVLDEALMAVVVLLLMVGVLVGVPTASETWSRGRTLGKWALGLRVVRTDGGPVTFRHAVVRALVGVVEVWMLGGVPAVFSAIAAPQGQRVGDLVAGTYVVRDRYRLRLPTPRPCPPHLVAWVRSADLGEPPVGVVVAARQLLARAPTLEPHHRWSAADGLARSLAAHVSPPPPAGVHPEDLVAAVLAERRDRDERRLRAEVAGRRRLDPS